MAPDYKGKFKKGFTLIELLITISIIGVLAAISFISYKNHQANSRDSGRVYDIQRLQDAVELYLEDNGHLPEGTTWSEFLVAIRGYYRGNFSGADAEHPYGYCHIPNTELYMVAALLEGKMNLNGDLDGMQYECNKCVYSPSNYICLNNPNCDDMLGGFLRNNNGTVICLGRPSSQ